MTKIEEVARAICGAHYGPSHIDWWKSFIPEALAAIAAMREPNDVMLDAADDSDDRGKYALQHWEAMIDAALAEHKEDAQ